MGVMKETCKQYQHLISGLLDGELSGEDRDRLEAHLAACGACSRERAAMQRLAVGASAAFAAPSVPDEVWDGFVDGVYARMERRAGWLLLLAGAIAFAVYGGVLFFTKPWTGALVKVLMATPVAGLLILFVSVLRQRLRSARTDRYSREVFR